MIGENQSPSFQGPFSADGWSPNVSGQTNGRSALTCGEDNPRCHLLHVLQKLRLSGARISAQQHVYITANLVFVACMTQYNAKNKRRNVWIKTIRRRNRYQDSSARHRISPVLRLSWCSRDRKSKARYSRLYDPRCADLYSEQVYSRCPLPSANLRFLSNLWQIND